MKNKPWYQRAQKSIASIIVGVAVIGSIAETTANLGIIPPAITYSGTLIILFSAGAVNFWLKKNPLRWITEDNTEVRIKSLSSGARLVLVGFVLALWIPRIPSLFESGFSSRPPVPQPAKIGLVAGHWGYDAGAVCLDANGDVTLIEAELNHKTMILVQQKLEGLKYSVEIFQEFDEGLKNFSGDALISIHADSCEFIDETATGFKVAAAQSKASDNKSEKLVNCMANEYEKTTGLFYHFESVTVDMRDYHAFSELDDNTSAMVIETGFLNLDHSLLIDHTEIVADGIVNGINCFTGRSSPTESKVAFDVLFQNDTYFVFIENVQSERVNLSSWSIRDEYGNQYKFDNSWELYPTDDRKIYVNTQIGDFPYWELSPSTIWKSNDLLFLIDEDDHKTVEIIP